MTRTSWPSALHAGRTISYGLAPEAMVRAENVNAAWPERLSFTVWFDGQSQTVHTQLPGAHLVHCALAAVAVGLAMGVPLEKAVRGDSKRAPIPGSHESGDSRRWSDLHPR